jgi:hypothetical protein
VIDSVIIQAPYRVPGKAGQMAMTLFELGTTYGILEQVEQVLNVLTLDRFFATLTFWLMTPGPQEACTPR